MRKINYKLIASDFDGTLIDDKQQIPEKVRFAIDDYVTSGGIFAVCTGRMLISILPRVRELGLKGLVVANQGVVIADIESGKILKSNEIDYLSVSEICKNLEELDSNVNLYCGDSLYSDIPKDSDYLKTYERIIGVQAIAVNGKASEFVLKNKLNCQKVACLVAKERRDLLYKELNGKLGSKFDVTCSAKVLIEVSPLNETKGEALKYLCNYFNVPIEKSIAVGDNLNDLSMIKQAGLGIAVANADEGLKAVADAISLSNNDGAIAEIIEKYGFTEYYV